MRSLILHANKFVTKIVEQSKRPKGIDHEKMISPFVHLSNKIAKPEVAKQLYELLMNKFTDSDFVVKSSHFGYHKNLLLDVKGHPGSFRYREFY